MYCIFFSQTGAGMKAKLYIKQGAFIWSRAVKQIPHLWGLIQHYMLNIYRSVLALRTFADRFHELKMKDSYRECKILDSPVQQILCRPEPTMNQLC